MTDLPEQRTPPSHSMYDRITLPLLRICEQLDTITMQVDQLQQLSVVESLYLYRYLHILLEHIHAKQSLPE